jgi:cytosine/uracil/thiamine/allantoin permease
VLIATLNTNVAANVVSPSNDFSNLNPRLRVAISTAARRHLRIPQRNQPERGGRFDRGLRCGAAGVAGAAASALYDYAWFVGFGVSGALYAILMQRAPAPANLPEWEGEG